MMSSSENATTGWAKSASPVATPKHARNKVETSGIVGDVEESARGWWWWKKEKEKRFARKKTIVANSAIVWPFLLIRRWVCFF